MKVSNMGNFSTSDIATMKLFLELQLLYGLPDFFDPDNSFFVKDLFYNEFYLTNNKNQIVKIDKIDRKLVLYHVVPTVENHVILDEKYLENYLFYNDQVKDYIDNYVSFISPLRLLSKDIIRDNSFYYIINESNNVVRKTYSPNTDRRSFKMFFTKKEACLEIILNKGYKVQEFEHSYTLMKCKKSFRVTKRCLHKWIRDNISD